MEERIDRCDQCCSIMRAKKGEEIKYNTDLIHVGGSACFHIDGHEPYTISIIDGDYCSTSCAIKAFSTKLVEAYDNVREQCRDICITMERVEGKP